MSPFRWRRKTPRRCEARSWEWDIRMKRGKHTRCEAAGVHLRNKLDLSFGKPKTKYRHCCEAHELLWDWEIRLYLRRIHGRRN